MDVNILNTVLNDLVKSNKSIEGAAVVASDGMMLASNLAQYIDEDNLGNVAAAFLSLGVRTDKEVKKTGFNKVVINNDDGDIVMLPIDENAILLAVTEANSDSKQLQKLMHEVIIKLKDTL